jgi:hypothetical protein
MKPTNVNFSQRPKNLVKSWQHFGGEGQCAQEHYWRNAAFSHFQELQAGHRFDQSSAFGVSYKRFFWPLYEPDASGGKYPEAQFLVPDWGMKPAKSVALSYRFASLCM